ncbi:hypothetical protein ABVT39_004276 [Epinephelus coioides]
MSGAVFTQPVARQPLPNRLVDEGRCKADEVDVVVRASVQLCECVCVDVCKQRKKVKQNVPAQLLDIVSFPSESGDLQNTEDGVSSEEEDGTEACVCVCHCVNALVREGVRVIDVV